MEKSKYRFIDEKAEEEERENCDNQPAEAFDFDESLHSASTALIFQDSQTSIYHAYFGNKQFTLISFFFQNESPLNHQLSLAGRKRKYPQSEIVVDFYQQLMNLQSQQGGYNKNMMKIMAVKCVPENKADILLGKIEGQVSSDKRKKNNTGKEVVLVFLEGYEKSIEDDIAERSLNQNSILCEDHILENFSEMIGCFNLFGTAIMKHLVISGHYLIIFREKLTKILPVFDLHMIGNYRIECQSQNNLKNQEEEQQYFAPLVLNFNQRETRSQTRNKEIQFAKEKQLKKGQQQQVKQSQPIAHRTRGKREGAEKIKKFDESSIEVEEEESQEEIEDMKIEEVQEEEEEEENNQIGIEEEEAEDEKKLYEKNENDILYDLSIIYLRVSSFMTEAKFNPQRKNKDLRIMQVIQQLIECKISSLFSEVFIERESPLNCATLLSIVNSYRVQKLTLDLTENTDLSELQKLLEGKTEIVLNYKDKSLEKLEELGSILCKSPQLFQSITSLEFKGDLCRMGDEGTFTVISIIENINPKQLQHLVISLRRNSVSELGIASIAQYVEKCINLTTFRIFFSYNRIRDQGLQFILKSISNLQQLEVLDLRFFDNQITHEGCQGFYALKEINFKNIKYLNISLGNNAISDEGCRMLSFFLCNIRNVKQLSIFLESNKITSAGMNALRGVFQRKNQIKYLILHALSNQIKDDGVIQILGNISKLTTLQSLEIILNENQLTEKSGVALGQAIKNMVHLTSLILSVRNNKISNQGVNAIGESLKNLKNLESLVLSLTNNAITGDGGIVIGRNLKHLSHLQKLHLVFYENQINHRSGKAIGEGLRTLTELNYLILGIGDNNVGDEGAETIGNCMLNLSKVKIFEIYLQNNNVSTNGASAIARGLSNMRNLKCLVFQIQHSEFGDQPMVELGKSIANLRQLKSLDIYVERCTISEEGGFALGAGLKNLQNIKVMVLDLDSNHIGPKGGKSLGDAFKNMGGLVDLKLYLKKNNIMQEGGTGLFEGLPYLKKLKSLNIDLYKNYTGDDCIAMCGRSLTLLKDLRSLELSITYNSLSQVGTQQFATFFSQCTSLHEVYLYMQKNNITPEGAESMGQALGCLKDLQQLKISFGNNQIQDLGISCIIKGAALCQNLKVLYLYAYNIGMTGEGCKTIAEELKKMRKLERFEFFPSANGQITFRNGLAQLAHAIIENHETLQNVRIDNAYWEENLRPILIPRTHNQIQTMQFLVYNRIMSSLMHCNPKAIFWDLIFN